ncbi:hypothetical protein SDC9_33203 [bioreactor metagenome]|uniref:Uncharacterized protein n=1 Tax=bioreactor metagenome TaxID=1076179 RepID=A0A644V796_9ZZZZ|nr:hypothetical protein [Candidatus Elulimicrobiales bacterium]
MKTFFLTTLFFLTTYTNSIVLSDSDFNFKSGINLEFHSLEKARKIDSYFKRYKMPLHGYGLEFVKAAEKYDLPYNFLAAIAVQESTGGKFCKNNNPFGWGGGKIRFSDFSEAIDVVSDKLANHKYYQGKNLDGKLLIYNSNPEYKQKILWIMEQI